MSDEPVRIAAASRRQGMDLRRDKMAQLGEFTVGVAHELNNSIGFIASNLGSLRRYGESLIALIERVEKHLPEDKLPRWREDLAAARWEFIVNDLSQLIRETQEGAEHLKHVVGDLKVLARTSPNTEVASIDACVASALTILAHQAKHRCKVERVLAAPRGLTMVRSQVIQLIINVVLNAIQALPTNGGTIRIASVDDGSTVTLIVEDSGPGVPPDLVEQIFDPYVTTKVSGTGVGLALARQIVSHHGGAISVQRSADLGGACFRITMVGAASPRSETQMG